MPIHLDFIKGALQIMYTDKSHMSLNSQIREALVRLCVQHLPEAQIEIDCIVCIAPGRDVAKQIVVKVHEVLETEPNGIKDICSSPTSRNPPRYKSIQEKPVDLSFKPDVIGYDKCDTELSALPTPLPLTPLVPFNSNGLPVPFRSGKLIEQPKFNNKNIFCKLCSKTFPNVVALQAHVFDLHDRYTCRFCYNTFSLRCNLKRHERGHNGIKPFTCHECGKRFARSTDLKVHIQSQKHCSPKKLQQPCQVIMPCPKCTRSFHEVECLRWHLCQDHKEPSSGYSCSMCEKLFLDRLEYEDHHKKHSKEEIEDASFDIQVRHLCTSTPISAVNTSKNVAGSRKRKSVNPIKHVVQSLEAEEEQLDDLYFNSTKAKQQADLHNHKQEELPYKPFPFGNLSHGISSPLNLSTMVFSSSTYLPVIHPGYSMITSPSFPSLITPHSSPSSSTPDSKEDIIRLGLDMSIDNTTQFHCSEGGCNENITGFSAYEDHCMVRHGRYPCKYCKQTFSGKNNRTRHMRCHLGNKTYTCPDCHKNFSRPDSMREHQFIHTLSYQEDKCRNCGASFDKKNLLLAHLKQCYRHKMETGKSTKLIDETPTYMEAKLESDVVNIDHSAIDLNSLISMPTLLVHCPVVKDEPLDDDHPTEDVFKSDHMNGLVFLGDSPSYSSNTSIKENLPINAKPEYSRITNNKHSFSQAPYGQHSDEHPVVNLLSAVKGLVQPIDVDQNANRSPIVE